MCGEEYQDRLFDLVLKGVFKVASQWCALSEDSNICIQM